MTLDNEQQRQFILELFKQVNFPGNVLDIAFAVKQAVSNAMVAETVAKQQEQYNATLATRDGQEQH